MDRFLSSIDNLDNIRFNLNYDYKSLNSWNRQALVLSGFNTDSLPLEDDDAALQPVLPAIDALNLLNDEEDEENAIYAKKDKQNESIVSLTFFDFMLNDFLIIKYSF